MEVDVLIRDRLFGSFFTCDVETHHCCHNCCCHHFCCYHCCEIFVVIVVFIIFVVTIVIATIATITYLHAFLRRPSPFWSLVMELDNPILFWLVRCLVAEKYLVEPMLVFMVTMFMRMIFMVMMFTIIIFMMRIFKVVRMFMIIRTALLD